MEAIFQRNIDPLMSDVLHQFCNERKPIQAIPNILPLSECQVHRVLNSAVEMGLLTEEERKPSYWRAVTVLEYMEKFPQATIAQIARISGTSEATVARTKRKMSDNDRIHD